MSTLILSEFIKQLQQRPYLLVNELNELNLSLLLNVRISGQRKTCGVNLLPPCWLGELNSEH